MNIFIKTFNRPYYLDRCLSSIEKFAEGGPYQIIVMDDGTEEKYLQKIHQKYPNIQIISSEYAKEKVSKINNHIKNGIPISGLKLPSDFWKNTIDKMAADYFLLLEDDIWFQTAIDIADAERIMKNENMALLKLFHFGNERLISGEKRKVAENLICVKPKLFTKNPLLFEHLLIGNPLKTASIFYKLGVWDKNLKINYYTIYNVAGCVFRKDYYAYLWQDVQNKVNEDKQLIKAVKYLKKNQPAFGYTPKEILRTSFTSSATNMFENIDFDVFKYNYLLNESWFEGNLDVGHNFEYDIAQEQIKMIIQPEISVEEWLKWQQKFISQYTAVGHKID